MSEEYDKPLHAHWKYETMESPAQELDEEGLDVAIANLMKEEAIRNKPDPWNRPEFPSLPSQVQINAQKRQKQKGVKSVLRQKLAELSGAA